MNSVTISEDLINSGFTIIRDSETILPYSIKSVINQLDGISKCYSENYVEQKLFRPRENHEFRQGDACMVSNGRPQGAPFLSLGFDHSSIKTLLKFYNDVTNNIFGDITENSRVLMNWQHYKQGGDNSLPFHCDCEIFEGEWTKNYIDLTYGLIPRYVMVLVTKNDNAGEGLEISKDGERLGIELFAGDIIIFDNTIVLHGVPNSCPNTRSMIGFRNFEAHPLLFSKNPLEDGHDYDNGFIKGQVKELSTKEARDLLREKGVIYG